MSENPLYQAPTEDPRLGIVVKDHRIIRKIGEGGMGAVYEGEHEIIKRKVAIKCLHAQFATNPEIVARFHNEAMATTRIEHPNIVQVTDMGRFEDGTVFMILELLKGQELAQLIDAEGPQTLGRIVHIMSQACDALQAAHDEGIIHRDLKPENVFLIKHGKDHDFVKVLDFGIAKFKEGGGNKSMTRTGTTMGTPYYMAPEQAQARKDIDHRADIYSLGVMLFHALSGQYPFDDESYPMLVVKICTEPPPPLRQFRPDIPEAFEALVNSMMSKDPNERPASCTDVRKALQPFRGQTGAPVLSDSLLPHAATMASMPNESGFRQAGGTSPDGSAIPLSEPVATPTPGGTQPIGTPADWSQRQQTPEMLTVPTGGSGKVLILAGAIASLLGVIGLGAAYALGAFGGETEVVSEPETPEPEEPVPDSTETPEEPAAVQNPQTPQQTVTVTIRTTPEDAQVFLDDRPIPNPFDGDLPQSDEIHNLRVEADGYQTRIQDFVLSFPQRVNVRLRRGRGTDDQRRRRTRRTPVTPIELPPVMETRMAEPAAMVTMESTTTAMVRETVTRETPMVTTPVMTTPVMRTTMMDSEFDRGTSMLFGGAGG